MNNNRNAIQRIEGIRDFKIPILGTLQSFPDNESNRVTWSCDKKNFSFLMIYSDKFQTQHFDIGKRDNSKGENTCLSQDN